jgi:hypothetical protein
MSLDVLICTAESRRKRAVASVERVTNGMTDSVNMGVSKVFANQKKIEAQAVQLQHQSDRFNRQTNQWVQLLDAFNDSLKVPSIEYFTELNIEHE